MDIKKLKLGDFVVLGADSWLDKKVKNPKTGREVMVKSLPPEERKKYKPAHTSRQLEKISKDAVRDGSMSDEVKEAAKDVVKRYSEHPEKMKHIIDTMKQGTKTPDTPYLNSKHLDIPIVNPHAKPTKQLGKGKPKDHRHDPFSWFDSKYGASKELLKKATGPMEIDTSSDLIARDDYVESIPKGSKIKIYKQAPDGLSFDEERLYTKSFPSNKRLDEAAKKLKQKGIHVEVVPYEK